MLEPGARLDRYEILAPLGAGGMGEVYRALDRRLGREVAIKVLPKEFAADRHRLARFEREAKALAALNHPHIAAIYGFERQDGLRFLVLELVEGETLAQRLSRGPLPCQEALGIAEQIGQALDAAHDRGIVHRDLKPANIKVTSEGTVKVLDFGLATASVERSGPADLTTSPTVSGGMTAAGAILGTAAYMSPEQARGKAVDRRTDVWAFGCVLYEMISGRLAFGGDTLSDAIAATLEREPRWDALPPETPRRVRELMVKCLNKDPKRRLRDIGDALLELELAMTEGDGATTAGDERLAAGATPRPRVWLGLFAAMLAVVASAVITWTFKPAPEPAPEQIVRLVMPLPEDAHLVASERSSLALSPDGSHVVWVGGKEGNARLFVRALAELKTAPLPETEGAVSPFFSPDGSSVGFFTEWEVRRISLAGGPSQRVIMSPPKSRGAYWGADGNIIFSPTKTSGLVTVSSAGGPFRMITEPDLASHAGGHCWPQLLPGGGSVLVTVLAPDASSYDQANISVIDLTSGRERVLITGGSYGRYVASGHIIFVRRGSLLAAPFDLEQLEVTGTSLPMVEGVLSDPASGVAHFAVSDSGTLVYAAGGQKSSARRSLVWHDRGGGSEPVTPEVAAFAWPRSSPDGRRLAFVIEGSTDDLWVLDLERGAKRRLTFEGRSIRPIWTPDGLSITYSSVRNSFPQIYNLRADGSGEAELVVNTERAAFASSWSPDGKVLAYTATGIGGKNDVFLLPRGGRPAAFGATRFNEGAAVFSPDGRWIAYMSDESGRFEVYLRKYPDTGAKWQISTLGGRQPLWAPDGRELFYRQGSSVLAVAVKTEPDLEVGRPETLFEDRFAWTLPNLASYDVTPDGRRFVLVRRVGERAGASELNVVLNWFQELRREIAPRR